MDNNREELPKRPQQGKVMSKTFDSKIETTIDADTGEILEQTETTNVRIFEREPDYVKVYIRDIVRLKELPPSTEKVIWRIIQGMGYNNTFTAYKPLKKMMASELGISYNTFNKAVVELASKGILIPMKEYGRGLYLVDPNLFARGKWDKIKQLRLTIDYNADTGERTIKSNMAKELVQLELFK